MVDYLIVGQGIAGTVLSRLLLQKGHTLKVIDSVKENCASRIAAGVYNPIAYRKLKMAQFANLQIPVVKTFYPRLEQDLGISFFEHSNFLKVITSIEELNNWQIQSAHPLNAPYMDQSIQHTEYNKSIKAPYGLGQVLNSGVVNVPKMLNAWAAYLQNHQCLVNENFDYSLLQISAEGLTYKNIQAKKIIFCEGIGIAQNPWFSWLPIQQFKGETITIHAPKLEINQLINRGVFVLPMGNDTFKVGATHDWKNVNETPSAEGLQELQEKLAAFIQVPYTVVKHQAGLRPASRDRLPYIGVHPQHKNLFVFNGLGSKGIIMAPWLGAQFVEGMEQNEFPKEFNIARYLKFYSDEKN